MKRRKPTPIDSLQLPGLNDVIVAQERHSTRSCRSVMSPGTLRHSSHLML